MASSIAVAFMSVMIGHAPHSHTQPQPTHNVTIIQGSNAMAVCRSMESKFHIAHPTTYGETKVSSTEMDNGKVRRETSCSQINL